LRKIEKNQRVVFNANLDDIKFVITSWLAISLEAIGNPSQINTNQKVINKTTSLPNLKEMLEEETWFFFRSILIK